MANYLEYFKVNFKIAWKIAIEYKANFFISLIQMFIFMSIHILGMYIVYYGIGDVIGWDFEKFVLFYFTLFLATIFAGLFTFHKYFSSDLLKGNINPHLTRPMNVYGSYTISRLSPWSILSFFVRTTGFILTIIYFEIKVNNIWSILLVLLITNVLYFVTYQFFYSWEFRLKKFGDQLNNGYSIVHGIVTYYPPPFFQKMNFKNLFLMLPTYLSGLLIIPLIYGESLLNFKIEVILVLTFTLVLGIIAFINWKYGLTRYEAFG